MMMMMMGRTAALVLAVFAGSASAADSSLLRGTDHTAASIAIPYNDVVMSKDGGSMALTVGPGYENSKISMGGPYTSGKLLVGVKSAAVAPGIITSVYLTTGGGRTGAGGGNGTAGTQDEIDLEWKGNDPYNVQSNVFLSGQEDLQMLSTGGDSSQGERVYGFEWDASKVTFFIDGAAVRTVQLARPLAPMMAYFSVWTTSGGWPGLIRWAGDMNWNARGGQPATANFRVIQMP